MNRPDPTNHGATDLLIEAYLDGELSAAEAAGVEAALQADPALLEELELARAVRDTLRGMSGEPIPEDLVPRVLAVARRDARSDLAATVRNWFRLGFAADWRPFVAMATLVGVVFGAVLVDRSGRTDPAMDPAVAEALEQVKWTLAVVADVGRRTGRAVRDDVLEPHVIEPMQDALTHVFEESQPNQ